jgi:hypothetical protein
VLVAKEGALVFKFKERSRGVSHVVHLGKASVAWLLEAVEALFCKGGQREFVKS